MTRINDLSQILMLFAIAAVATGAQAPDNTERNKRDRTDQAVTAGSQGASEADRELARKIRKELVADKEMSVNGHNSKVIVRDGKVTLRGPVETESEKNKIGAIAARHAGEGKVANELEVTATKQLKGNK
jgi:hyperosmotically inducible periplasmic protein